MSRVRWCVAVGFLGGERNLRGDLDHCDVEQGDLRIETQDALGKRFDALQWSAGRFLGS